MAEVTINTSAFPLLFLLFFLHFFQSIGGQQTPVIHHHDTSTCEILDLHIPNTVSFRHSETYKSQTNSYWSLNQGHDLHSTCRVTPHNVTDLQQILSIISTAGTPFAVKSGGHSVVANTSNVENGIVIDLEALNNITIDKDSKHIDVGVGARWKDVYAFLNGTGYGVTGARAGSVGVGGYLLGGGLSIYEGTQGWACDSALSFEVVLTNGTVVEANSEQHKDLFRALKGSATNFGIVTRARLRLVPNSPDVDAIILSYGIEHLQDVIEATVLYNHEAHRDPAATIAISVGGTTNGFHLGISIFVTHPISISASPVLKRFFAIPHSVGTQMRMTQIEMAKLYDDMNPGGYRQFRTTTTVLNDAKSLDAVGTDLIELFGQLVSLNDTNIQCGFLVQPLTLPHLHASKAVRVGTGAGGNILGLENENAPLLLISLEIRYSDVKDSSIVTSLGSTFMVRIEDSAASKRQLHDYRYLNYASARQDVFRHVRADAETWLWLLKVKQAYDPRNTFGRQMLHPFKIQVGQN